MEGRAMAVLAVRDIDAAARFYGDALGMRVVQDFGANKVLDGGIALQSLGSWKGLIGTDEVSFGGNDSEVYLEEGDFDGFLARLGELDIDYVHPPKEHPWGQRAIRFRDPDGHIIEVGEDMAAVARRFSDAGMTPAEVAARMDVSVRYVSELLRQT